MYIQMLGIDYPSFLNLLCLYCWAGVLTELLNYIGVRFLGCFWLAIPKRGAIDPWKLLSTCLFGFCQIIWERN